MNRTPHCSARCASLLGLLLAAFTASAVPLHVTVGNGPVTDMRLAHGHPSRAASSLVSADTVSAWMSVCMRAPRAS